MFFSSLKRQYFSWCLFVGSLESSRIIENVMSLEILRLFVNVFMILAGAFVFYCVAYPFSVIFRRFRDGYARRNEF